MNHCYNKKSLTSIIYLIPNACITCAVVFFFNEEGKSCSLRVLSDCQDEHWVSTHKKWMYTSGTCDTSLTPHISCIFFAKVSLSQRLLTSPLLSCNSFILNQVQWNLISTTYTARKSIIFHFTFLTAEAVFLFHNTSLMTSNIIPPTINHNNLLTFQYQ